MARVLVVEDNSANLELMVYLLQAFGHRPAATRDGREGLDAAFLMKPDLILCDVQMPHVDGYEVARQLKSDPVLRHVPLVAVTAYAMVGDRDKVLAGGFDGYIPKPIVAETFVQQVEAYLPPEQRSTARPAPSAEPTPPAAAAAPAGLLGTVLVVDDMEVNIDLLRGILEPSGYRVASAYSVREALEVARQARPDLILSDLRMPDADGYELLRLMKGDQELRRIPVIIHSASAATAKDHAEAMALGAIRSIQRPIDPRRLLQLIAACLQQMRPE